MTTDDEAEFHRLTAHNRLEDSQDVSAIGKFGAAVSMSYYAVFHAAKSILTFLGEETKTHQGTISRFHFRTVYESDFSGEVAGSLERLRASREDYLPTVAAPWDNESAAEAIAMAERFINETDAWFNRRRFEA